MLACLSKVKYSYTDCQWIHSPEFETYVFSWKNLVKYYQSHDDDTVTNVSFEIVHAYLRSSKILSTVLLKSGCLDYHEDAKEALAILESWMIGIINAGYDKVNSDEDFQTNALPDA